MAVDTSTENYRRECEARDWLRRGYTTPGKVNDLIAGIAQKRGTAAVEQLRNEMCQQWLRRTDWQGAPV